VGCITEDIWPGHNRSGFFVYGILFITAPVLMADALMLVFAGLLKWI
jgi:hypothetical protein